MSPGRALALALLAGALARPAKADVAHSVAVCMDANRNEVPCGQSPAPSASGRGSKAPNLTGPNPGQYVQGAYNGALDMIQKQQQEQYQKELQRQKESGQQTAQQIQNGMSEDAARMSRLHGHFVFHPAKLDGKTVMVARFDPNATKARFELLPDDGKEPCLAQEPAEAVEVGDLIDHLYDDYKFLNDAKELSDLKLTGLLKAGVGVIGVFAPIGEVIWTAAKVARDASEGNDYGGAYKGMKLAVGAGLTLFSAPVGAGFGVWSFTVQHGVEAAIAMDIRNSALNHGRELSLAEADKRARAEIEDACKDHDSWLQFACTFSQ